MSSPNRSKAFDQINETDKSKEEIPLNSTQRVVNPKCRENFIYYFRDFGENASIDGLKFLSESGRTLVERIFWAVVLIVSMGFCIYLVVETFKKWISSPVIVSFDTSQTPIFDIPFPAVTICPEVKVFKSIFNYTDVYLKKENNISLTVQEQEEFEYVSLLCDSPPNLVRKAAFPNDEELINFFLEATPSISDIFMLVKWRNKIITENITNLFFPILTSQGVCFSFNLLDRKELFTDKISFHQDFFSINRTTSKWSVDKGYAKNANLDSYPFRTLSSGATEGLDIILFAFKRDLDYACGDALQGFKVMIHNPTEFPQVEHNYFRVPLNQVLMTAVKPDLMITTDDLKGYSVTDRNCYFPLERKLKFFQIYSQQNCLTECLSNFTQLMCGCAKFYMPREHSVPICGGSSDANNCTESAEDAFLMFEVGLDIVKTSDLIKDKNSQEVTAEKQCNCLPVCDSLDYNVEVSQSALNTKEVVGVSLNVPKEKQHAQLLRDNRVYLTRLKIFFKDMQFIAIKRGELYGHTEFWANIGGTVGLFTGFSFVTMFELIYYLSLRLGCNIRMFGRRYWSGSEELLEGAKNKH